MNSVRRLFVWENLFQLRKQGGQVVCYNLPQNIFVHLHVIMDNPMTHPYNLPPRDLGVLVTKFSGDFSRRLPNHLHQMREAQSQDFIPVVVRSGLRRNSPNSLPGHIQHVTQIYAIFLSCHR